jgi:HAD superfamily hydrolase (TIGR01509 family)
MPDPSTPPAVALVFDMDGTIIDSREAYVLTMVQVFRDLGYPRSKRDVEEGLIPSIAGTARGMLPPDERLVATADDMIRHLVWKRAAKVSVCLGVPPTLRRLKAGHRLGLLTGSDRSFVQATLGPLGLLSFFDEVVTVNTPLPTKEGRYMHLLSLLDVGPSEAVMVGDSPSDVEVAKKAGSRTIAIYNSSSWMWGRKAELLDSEPDMIVDRFEDLLGLELG